VATTLTQLLTEFYARGFSYLNDGGAGATRATAWINQSYLNLCTRADFPFLFADATGTAPLTIADLRVVLSVYDATQKNPLVAIDRATLISTYKDLTLTGTPRYWYRNSQTQVSVYPANTGSTLNVRYVKRPALLSTGSDAVVVPDEWADDDYDNYVAQSEADIQRMRDAELDDNAAPDYVLHTDLY
jgi:hypothetical protein